MRKIVLHLLILLSFVSVSLAAVPGGEITIQGITTEAGQPGMMIKIVNPDVINQPPVINVEKPTGISFESVGETEPFKPFLGAAVYGKNVSNSDSAGAGVYGSSYKGNGIVGQTMGAGKAGVEGLDMSSGGKGVVGSSASGVGVYGEGILGDGVEGLSTKGNGVYGETSAAGKAGVVGKNPGDGTGVSGASENGYGVYGYSNKKIGVCGEGAIGVYGSTVAAGNDDSAFKVKLIDFNKISSTAEYFIGKNLKVYSLDFVWKYFDEPDIWETQSLFAKQDRNMDVLYNANAGKVIVWGDFEKPISMRCMVVYK